MLATCVRWIRWGVLSAALAAAVVMPGRAEADSEWPSDDAGYRERIRKALQEYQVGNWAEAKLFFSEAHAIYPNARTLRGLGLVAYALRDYVQAIGYLESAQINPVQPLTPDLRAQIAKLLAQSRRFVARVAVTLEPADAELRVDEQPAARTPDGSVWLNPGTHELVATRDGYERTMRRVAAEAGTSIALRLSLQPLAAVPAAAPELPVPRAQPKPAPASGEPDDLESNSEAPYIVIALGAAVAVTGGVLLGIALNDIDDLERPKANTPWAAVERDYRSTPALSGAGIGLIGVGAAGIGAGLLWALWPDRERDDVALQVSPSGFSVRGAL